MTHPALLLHHDMATVTAAGHRIVPRPTPEVISRVAVAFCGVLGAWMGPQRLAEAARRNAGEARAGICHTHDFIDSNEAMAEAFEQCGLLAHMEEDGEMHIADQSLHVWNAAWDLAKACGFDACRVQPPTD